MTEIRTLELDRLLNGVGTYSTRKCATALEAALLCLEKTAHFPGVACRLERAAEAEGYVALHWRERIDDIIRESWRDEFELVEWGAIGMALLMIAEFTDFDAISQARRGTGVDFSLGYSSDFGAREGFPAHAVRLEISGILRAKGSNTVASRVKEKLARLNKYNNVDAPVYIIVTEFGEPMIHWSERETTNE